MARNLTAADAVIMLGITGLFPVAQQLQGFAADDVFDTDPVEPVEVAMGVDGKLSAGWTSVPVPWNITLQADSPSNDVFETWYGAQQTSRSILFANVTVNIPGTGRLYTMTKGVLQRHLITPPAKKILQPRKYGLLFESVSAANA